MNQYESWNSATVYTINNLVVYQGVVWVSLQSPNQNNVPQAGSLFWGVQGGGGGGGTVQSVSAGAGISVSGTTNVVVGNTGVLDLSAGTGVTITGSKTNYTISATPTPVPILLNSFTTQFAPLQTGFVDSTQTPIINMSVLYTPTVSGRVVVNAFVNIGLAVAPSPYATTNWNLSFSVSSSIGVRQYVIQSAIVGFRNGLDTPLISINGGASLVAGTPYEIAMDIVGSNSVTNDVLLGRSWNVVFYPGATD